MKPRRNLDLQLLACLDALIAECSVTRAAERLGMSQPGMSNALARLRRLTNDELLVRTSHGMLPTPRALELAASVQAGMRAFEDVLGDHGPFNPGKAEGNITIATADFLGMLLFPQVMARLREQAPGLSVEMRLPDPMHIRQWLADGACDLVLGYLPGLPDGLRSSVLFSEPLACLVARVHPKIGERISLAQFAAAHHVTFGSPYGPVSTLEALLEQVLGDLGVQRKVGMRVASAMLSPYVVARTPMVAVVPRVFGRHFATFLPLRVLPTPFEAPPIECRMVWHERSHRLGMHQWVRGVLRQVVDEYLASAQGAVAAA